MSDANPTTNRSASPLSDNPTDWGPPEAPLFMPVQNLTPTPIRFRFFTQVSHLFANLRSGSRREI